MYVCTGSVKRSNRVVAAMFRLPRRSDGSSSNIYFLILQLNDTIYILQVRARGSCLFESVRRQISCPYEFTNSHLRRQCVYFLCKAGDYFVTAAENFLRVTYGDGDGSPEKPGPFSYTDYLKYMLKPKSWGDELILSAISIMWQCSISVIFTDSLGELRLRHTKVDLSSVDIVLCYSGGRHYCATSKYQLFSFILL